jgi:hypothetical protein
MLIKLKSVVHILILDPDNDSTHSFGVDGTYYFNPVQTRNAPLAEAAFLNRASNVKANVNYADNSGKRYSIWRRC